jgi:hypothetical protein
MNKIELLDANREVIGTVERKAMKRFSMQARSDERQMDAAKDKNPRVTYARIGEAFFKFGGAGQSMLLGIEQPDGRIVSLSNKEVKL